MDGTLRKLLHLNLKWEEEEKEEMVWKSSIFTEIIV